MEKYQLTELDINTGINRFLLDIYSYAERSENPKLVIIAAGPGAGKTGIETFYKKKIRDLGERAAIVNSDKIAMYHPEYIEILENELPGDFYNLTRKFVRPATPAIFEDLKQRNINIINENILNKGQADIDMIKEFKEAGYHVSINIMATDIYIARLSSYQREAKELELGIAPRGISKENHEKMYNAYTDEVYLLQNEQLIDEINVYTRGETINEPKLIFTNGDNRYRDFYEALQSERNRQRKEILKQPGEFFGKIEDTAEVIRKNGISKELTNNALKGLNELKNDFIQELTQTVERTEE